MGELRPFQRDVAEQAGNVVIVKAGCGSGKTLLAYHWARTRWPGRRIYFCYPTTGTATEGFRDYLFNPDEKESKYGAELFHGRAWVDLNVILGVKGDETREEADGIARIESLDAWSTPIVSCTVDTVLGLVQNNRRGLYAWPALAGAAFVFDEIHAYDDRLFGALLRFLQALPGAPVLLMTASLPCARLEALRQCLRRQNKELLVVPGPAELEQRKRYHRLAKGTDPLTEAQAEIERGGKVLWVCNTVARVMAAAESLGGCSPKIYHSRFRYVDRVERHKAVVNAFQPENKEAVVACCSQVAELSLDLKGTTLLVTELAPVHALIQRLGRLNRRAEANDPARPFLVVEPMNDDGSPAVLPYAPQDLEDAKNWLDALGDGPLSQTDLAKKWEEYDTASRPDFVGSAWLDGGPSTQVLELREPSPGLTVVLNRDWADLKSGTRSVTEVALPMPPPPRGMDWRKWPEFKGVPVASPDLIDYDPERGAQWGSRLTSEPGAKGAEPPNYLTMNLFDPGMTILHRAGLGGLASSLRYIKRAWKSDVILTDELPGGPWPEGKPPWDVSAQSITLRFGDPKEAREFLAPSFPVVVPAEGRAHLPSGTVRRHAAVVGCPRRDSSRVDAHVLAARQDAETGEESDLVSGRSRGGRPAGYGRVQDV